MGVFYKTAELCVSYRALVHPETIDGDRVSGRLFRIVVVGSHRESATGNPNHVLCRWFVSGAGTVKVVC
jgi:hypothetical protein